MMKSLLFISSLLAYKVLLYFMLRREEKLIVPIMKDNKEIRYYICCDNLFYILVETHLAIDHG